MRNLYKTPNSIKCNSNKVCKWNEALYDLRCWFRSFKQALEECGYANLSADWSLYIWDAESVLQHIYICIIY